MKIEEIINGIIQREGGYVNDPTDRGGATNFGITEGVARAWGYQGDMKTLPEATARQIYLDRYWLQPKFDKVAELAPRLAEELADTGVNMGVAVAGKFLQRALNHLNLDGKAYPELTVDGGLGKMSLFALATFLKLRPEGEKVLTQLCNSQQAVRYMEITEAKSDQEKFAYGWQLHRATEA
jgi:lysozyme family protein